MGEQCFLWRNLHQIDLPNVWKLLFGGLASEIAGEIYSVLSSREVNCRDLRKCWICMSGSSWEELATMSQKEMHRNGSVAIS